jgi:hypothetical protein
MILGDIKKRKNSKLFKNNCYNFYTEKIVMGFVAIVTFLLSFGVILKESKQFRRR